MSWGVVAWELGKRSPGPHAWPFHTRWLWWRLESVLSGVLPLVSLITVTLPPTPFPSSVFSSPSHSPWMPSLLILRGSVSLRDRVPVRDRFGLETGLARKGRRRRCFSSVRRLFPGPTSGWDSGVRVPASALPPPSCATPCKSQALSVLQSFHLPARVGLGHAEGLHRCPLGDLAGSPGSE